MKLELKPNRHYDRVHSWIKSNYGNADRCESSDCNGKSNSYHWAKLHSASYDYNINYFVMLCQSCHKKYDMTDKTRLKMSVSKRGENHPLSKLTQTQVDEIKIKYIPRKITQKMLASEYGVCVHTIHYILKGRTWKN